MQHQDQSQEGGYTSPTPDHMERKEFNLPNIAQTKNGQFGTGYGGNQTERSDIYPPGRTGSKYTDYKDIELFLNKTNLFHFSFIVSPTM